MYLFGKGLDRSNKLDIDFLDDTHLGMSYCIVWVSVADPGFPVGGHGLCRGAIDPRGGYVSKILHVKMKESGSVGGCMCWVHPPKSANGFATSNTEIGDDQ